MAGWPYGSFWSRLVAKQLGDGNHRWWLRVKSDLSADGGGCRLGQQRDACESAAIARHMMRGPRLECRDARKRRKGRAMIGGCVERSEPQLAAEGGGSVGRRPQTWWIRAW